MGGEEASKPMDGGAREGHYRETLAYLYGLQKFGIKLGLANMIALLQVLGNPHQGLSAVHIGGSNGKGSTAVFLTSILRQAGYRVGLYTSPHLIDFSERIRINGVPIPENKVVAFTERIREAVEKMTGDGNHWSDTSLPLPADFDPQKTTITFFEFTTAMALLYFRESQVDFAVLETGMGGRLDATNVIDPLLSLITSISLEHQQYLGRTLLQIAGEKAGIIKHQRPLLTTVQQPRVLALFREKCQELQAPCYVWGKDFSAKKGGPQLFQFRGRSHQWSNLSLGLAGDHQIRNASLALAAAEVLMELGFSIQEEHLRRGLADTAWPGRLELIGVSPRILLDGAHNPEATRVLRRFLQKGFPRRRLIFVIGIMKDKDISRMMAQLSPMADLLILTRPQMDRAAPLGLLRKYGERWAKPMVEVPKVSSALQVALDEAGAEDLIVVAGSLYTVGEARAELIRRGVIHS